ncbi:SAM-dependent methyltransferase [Actinoallomurus iriomotensis]|uniref:S-adenosyl methyltransferase n=1 Tax=Actinoallomurus iriomotensis TaxID=478107 RepID=A0A9W6SEB0_9ACTN|nr:SAM-dependent methyltransferase [Actinoallomurus iriomotensis]GLY91908.1 hypothetical protein Airi02_098360 [Actinoallomurus iriomotensis]
MSPLNALEDSQPALPTEAGIYDYLRGGRHYTPADANAAEMALEAAPETRFAAEENRRFLCRAVRHLARQGVCQYIDLGSGYLTGRQVHEVAGEIVPDPHVVYVDYDPRVAAANQRMLRERSYVAATTGDVRDPGSILADPAVTRLIDWSKPVAVLALAVFHFIKDAEDPLKIVAAFRERMASGSHFVISHGSGGENREAAGDAGQAWENSRSTIVMREPGEIAEFFSGLEIAGPGIVTTSEWGTDAPAPAGQSVILCGVGRVP